MNRSEVMEEIRKTMGMLKLGPDQVIVGGDTAVLILDMRTEDVEQVNLWIPVPHWKDQWRWMCEPVDNRLGEYIQWAENVRLYAGFLDTNITLVEDISCYGVDLLIWQYKSFTGDYGNNRAFNEQLYKDLTEMHKHSPRSHHQIKRDYPDR